MEREFPAERHDHERDIRFFALDRAAVNTARLEGGRLEHRVSSPDFICNILRNYDGLLSVTFLDRVS